jgi:hypothetical protein
MVISSTEFLMASLRRMRMIVLAALMRVSGGSLEKRIVRTFVFSVSLYTTPYFALSINLILIFVNSDSRTDESCFPHEMVPFQRRIL